MTDAAPPPPPPPAPRRARHGVVVVHGQEDIARRGDMIVEVFEPISEALRASHLEIHTALEAHADAAEGRLTVEWTEHPGAAPRLDEFEIREAYWADAFPPPPPGQVVAWLSHSLLRQVPAVLRGWATRPRLTPGGRQPPDAEVIAAETPWGKVAFWALFALLLVAAAPFLALGLVLGLVVYPLASLPLLRPLGLGWLHNTVATRVDPFMSAVLGDTQRYAESEWWADNARRRVEDAVCALLDDRSIEDLAIVAYSAGCTVTAEALRAGGPVEAALRAHSPARPVTLITLGGALNRVYLFARDSTTAAGKRFLEGRLSPALADADFTWIDLHARYDYVPGGPLINEVRDAAPRGTTFVDRLVVNIDSPLRDHFEYFTNRDAVVPRIVAALFGAYRDEPARATLANADMLTRRDRSPLQASREGINRRIDRAALLRLSQVGFGALAVAMALRFWLSAGLRDRLADLAYWLGDRLGAIGEGGAAQALMDRSGLDEWAADHPAVVGLLLVLAGLYALAAALGSLCMAWLRGRLSPRNPWHIAWGGTLIVGGIAGAVVTLITLLFAR